MRRILFSLLAVLIVSVSLVGCKKPLSDEEKAKMTVEKFVEYVKTEKIDSALVVYPGSKNFVNTLDFETITITGTTQIENTSDYTVLCNNTYHDKNGELTNSAMKFNVEILKYSDDDVQTIVSSQGALQLPFEVLSFLTKTGAIKKWSYDDNIVDEWPAFSEFIKYYLDKYGMSLEEIMGNGLSGEEYNDFLADHPLIKGQMKFE